MTHIWIHASTDKIIVDFIDAGSAFFLDTIEGTAEEMCAQERDEEQACYFEECSSKAQHSIVFQNAVWTRIKRLFHS